MSKAATPQDTEEMVFGSGFDAYWYWGASSRMVSGPDGWEWLVQVWNMDDEKYERWSVSHETVMRAVRSIASGEIKWASERLIEQCGLLLIGSDEADLDADGVDSLMQVAVFGEIVY